MINGRSISIDQRRIDQRRQGASAPCPRDELVMDGDCKPLGRSPLKSCGSFSYGSRRLTKLPQTAAAWPLLPSVGLRVSLPNQTPAVRLRPGT